jgi:hypothetical protein
MANPDWIGIGIGAALAIFGIYLTVRRAKYPGGLVFIRRQSIALLNSPATRLPNLKLLYKETPIGKSVLLISGYIANDGAVDIKPADVEQPLTCELPGGCVWLEFSVTASSPELAVESQLQGSNVVTLNFGQFRRDESFAFQALAQLDDEHSKKHARTFPALLKWRHRIAGVGAVKQTEIEPLQKRTRLWSFLRATGILLMGAFMVALAFKNFGLFWEAAPIVAFEYSAGGRKAVYNVDPTGPKMATLKAVDGEDEITIDLQAALASSSLKPVQVVPRRKFSATVMSAVGGGFFLLFGIGSVAIHFVPEREQKRLHRLVASSNAAVVRK